jgi:hypothetical protein
MLRTIGIRELKSKLSACLRDVQRGDVYMVADRGRVVAELKQPAVCAAVDTVYPALAKMVIEGKMRPPLTKKGEGHRRALASHPKATRLTSEQIKGALDWTRGDR